MKLIQKLITLPAAVLIFVFLTVSAFAAGTAPEIQLSETGAENQYKITIKNWDSGAYSVQFGLSVDSADAEFRMEWADGSSSSFKKVDQETNGGKTNLEFYLDRLSPISNSDSAVIGNITFFSEKQKLSFSGTASLKLVDKGYGEKTFEAVPVKTVAWTPPDEGSSGGSGDPDSGNSSSDNSSTAGGSSSSGSSSGRGSSKSKDSKSAKADSSEPASYQGKKSASPAVSWDKISKDIQERDGKSVLTVDMTGDGRISADILKKLKEKKVLVTLNYGKYRWVIDGSTIGAIPDNQKYYDLTVTLLSMQNLSAATDRTDLVQFEVAYDGALPFTATLYYPVGKEFAGKTVTLSYYDEQKGTLDFRASATAEADGMVAFSFDHFSKYVLTSQDLWHEEGTETAKTASTVAAAASQTVSRTVSVLVPPAGDTISAEAAAEKEEETEPQPSSQEELEEQTSGQEPGQEETAPVSQGTVQDSNTVSPTLWIVVLSAAAIVILVVLSVVKKKSSQGRKGR